MQSKDDIYMNTAYEAVKSNDIELMKQSLNSLMLLKKPNIIKDIFNKFKYIGQNIINMDGLKSRNQGLINGLLSESIRNKNFEIFQYLIDSNEILIKPELDNSATWEGVFYYTDLRMLKHLMNEPNIKDKGKHVTKGLESIQENGISILEFLFDSSKPHYEDFIENFKEYNKPSIFIRTFNPFIYASEKNSKLLIDFYLNNKEIKPFINVITFSKGMEAIVFSKNSLEVLDYLLNNPKMPYKLYRDYLADNLIFKAIKNNARHALRYLICDQEVKLEKNLDDLLNISNFPKSIGSIPIDSNQLLDSIQFAKELFSKQELKKSLESNLEINTSKSKKSKL